MNSFWDGFEKKAFLGTLATGIASHVIPNAATLKLLKSKRFAHHMGDSFSEGLFNLPTTRRAAFGQGLAGGGLSAEYTLGQNALRHAGNQLREHLVKKVPNLTDESSMQALKHLFGGDMKAAVNLHPETVNAVLEFAKQNKFHPASLVTEGDKLFSDPNHPLLSNVMRNLIHLPKRAKGKVAPKLTGAQLEEADLGRMADSHHPIKRFIPDSWKKPHDIDGEIIQPRQTGRGISGNMSEEALDNIVKRHGPSSRLPGFLRPKEMETYIPDLRQVGGPAEKRHEWARSLGVATAGAGLGAVDPGLVANAGKYFYFNNPKARSWLRDKARVGVKGKEYGLHQLEDAATTGRLEGAFRKGFLEDKNLNPYTSFFHRYGFSGLQGEAARSINAVGRSATKVVPPEHRKNVYEHALSFAHGEPGAFQASAAPTPMREQLKPFVMPAAVATGAGAGAFLLGRHNRDKGVSRQPMDNVRPFVRPPMPMQQPQEAMG